MTNSRNVAELASFIPSPLATPRTVTSKLEDTVSPRDFGAVGNGVTNDSTAFFAAKSYIEAQQINGLFVATDGTYNVTADVWDNHVEPTLMRMSRPGVLGVFEGSRTNPDELNDGPAVWAQKYTRYDSDGDRFAHNVGGAFGEIVILGSGVPGVDDIEGTWIGVLGNAVMEGVNLGSPTIPDYDAFGSVVGVAGFATSNGYPGDGNIVTGIWGYSNGPTIDNTTFSNLPATNWSIVGAETNVQINHPDIGERSELSGKGSSVGYLAYNYRTPNTGRKDWTFGLVLTGNKNNPGLGDGNIDNWNGFYCGIFLDNIKAKGIRFGTHIKTGSYGIYFPDVYAGTEEPAAAIYLGNSKIAMGQYVGTTFNNNDFWHNAGNLYFQYAGTSRRALLHDQATGNIPTSTGINFRTNGNFSQFSIGSVASSVNQIRVDGSVTGSAPTVYSQGADSSIDLNLRPKGTGRISFGTWTSSSDAPIDGYIEIRDSNGNIRKIATIA